MKRRRLNAELAELAESKRFLRVQRVLRLIVFVGCSLAVAATVDATVVVPADLGELSRDARAIVRGRVMALDVRWTEDRRTIETVITLEVESYLKGPLGRTLQFRVPGGELGRFRSITVGAPEFSIDERVVVFLGATGPSIPYVLGLNQGVFRIVHAADGWVVTPPPALPSAAGSAPIVRGDPSRRPLPLVDFEQRVRALAAAPR
jgi:hypothetical protein